VAGKQSYHSPQSNAEAKNALELHLHASAFMAWRLINTETASPFILPYEFVRDELTYYSPTMAVGLLPRA
jgi:hypothetical protein